jgi:hypothetical protein
MRGNHRLSNTLVRAQHSFYFRNFYSMPTYFYLIINAPQVLQRSIGTPARQVAGAVQALTYCKRIWDEPFCGQAGTVQVATRQSSAPYIELSNRTDRDRVQPLVKHVDFDV